MIKLFPTIKKILRWLAGQDAVNTESPLEVAGTTGHVYRKAVVVC